MVISRQFLATLLLLSLTLSSCGGNAKKPERLSEQELAGERLFIQNCASCHATSPQTIIVGPSLAGIASTAAGKVPGQDARSYIETSVLEPGAYINEGFNDLMPMTFGKTLTGEELDSLIAYLFTLE